MQNQVRQYLKFQLIHYWRLWVNQSLLGSCGEGVYFDRAVRLLRFPKNIFLGDKVVVKEGVQICACNPKATIRIGRNTTVGYYTFIFASGKISIGNDCLIAPFVYIVDSDHDTRRDQLINQQDNIVAPIMIGDDVWLATGAKILKGVTIGDGAMIAAGAVVKEDVASYKIVGGVPARVLGERE